MAPSPQTPCADGARLRPAIDRRDITGLVLAGGRGSRMGGVDKGLQPLHGRPLALHVLQRLAPQVGATMVNANRNLAAYERFGVPVWPDADTAHAGPLAGFLCGLAHCSTPYLMTVPCDTPLFPDDLVARLAAALAAHGADLAMPRSSSDNSSGDGTPRLQPVFCLMRSELLGSVARFVGEGGHKVAQWTERHAVAVVDIDDRTAFASANTPGELRALGTLQVPAAGMAAAHD